MNQYLPVVGLGAIVVKFPGGVGTVVAVWVGVEGVWVWVGWTADDVDFVGMAVGVVTATVVLVTACVDVTGTWLLGWMVVEVAFILIVPLVVLLSLETKRKTHI